MIVGNPNLFAIESTITTAYERLSFRAIGSFTIHAGGYRYGVQDLNATMLACSFDAVSARILNRGNHTAPFANDPQPGGVAEAVRHALYADCAESQSFFGLSRVQFAGMIHSRKLLWAPDGDAAFDDGSFVLQFDLEDRVRLIAFQSTVGYEHDPGTLRDVWLAADDFYEILREWCDAFEREWLRAPKLLEE